MEDEGFVDDDFIETTARDYVARYGRDAVAELRKQAAIAAGAGDKLMAAAWEEIAELAADMLWLGRG